jgi:hypothetical protein
VRRRVGWDIDPPIPRRVSFGLSSSVAPPSTYFSPKRLLTELREACLGERGFLFTAYRCLFFFGDSMRIVLSGQGEGLGYHPPLKFLTVCVALTVMASHFFSASLDQIRGLDQAPLKALVPSIEGLETFMADQDASPELKLRVKRAIAELSMSEAERVQNEINKWLNVGLLLAVPVIAAGTWLCFRRDYNWVEHLVITSYLYSIQCLLWFLCLPIVPWFPSTVPIVYFLISIIYQLVAWRAIFGFHQWHDWILAIAALILTFIAYGCVVIAFLVLLIVSSFL